MIKFIKKLFCKHSWILDGKKFVNDTDFTGNFYEVLKCEKCGKYIFGQITQ